MKRIKRQDYAKQFATLRKAGLSYEKIAKKLDVSLSTVKRLARDARSQEQPAPKFSEALVEISRYAVMDCATELWRIGNVLETVEFRGAFYPDECRKAVSKIRALSGKLRELKWPKP